MLTIFIAAFLVSFEALFIGMCLRLQKGFKYYLSLIVSVIILAGALAAFLLTAVLKKYIDYNISWIVGTIFLLLALKSLFEKDEEEINFSKFWSIVIMGLTMSLDGALTTVALTFNHGQLIIIPFLVAIGHLVFLYLGNFIAGYIKASHKVHRIIACLCLLAVAVLSFTGI